MKLLEIPFAYRAEYVAARKRVPQEAWILDSVPVRLAEASEGEAPVAASMTQDVTENVRIGNGYEERVRRVDVAYRVLDGRLLRPYCAALELAEHRYADSRPMGLEDARADLAAWAGRAAAPNQGFRGGAPVERMNPEEHLAYRYGFAHRLFPAVPRGGVDAREWHSDDRAARRSVISRALDGKAALVGGILHIPSSGPAWLAGPDDLVAVSEFSLASPSLSVFPGDQEARARDHADYLAAAVRGAGRPPSPVRGAIEIIDRSPFAGIGRESDALALAYVAGQITGSDYGHSVWKASADVISAYADAKRLEDAVEVADPMAAAEGLAALERSLRRILGANCDHPRVPYGEELLHRLRAAPVLGDMPAPRGP